MPSVAVVGDYNPRNQTHLDTDAALDQLGLAFDWVQTESVADEGADRLAGFDAVLVAPASPYRSMDGALVAIRHARERGVPLVGT
jgi:CTP synthase (UTP-ammonia lyase)